MELLNMKEVGIIYQLTIMAGSTDYSNVIDKSSLALCFLL